MCRMLLQETVEIRGTVDKKRIKPFEYQLEVSLPYDTSLEDLDEDKGIHFNEGMDELIIPYIGKGKNDDEARSLKHLVLVNDVSSITCDIRGLTHVKDFVDDRGCIFAVLYYLKTASRQ